MLKVRSKISTLVGTVSGLWLLTVPLLVSADEILFNKVFQPERTTVSGRQDAVTKLFDQRTFPVMVYGVGAAAIFSLVYAGYLYITAQGKPDQAEKGKRVAIYTILGLLLLGLVLIILTASRNVGAGIANQSVTPTL